MVLADIKYSIHLCHIRTNTVVTDCVAPPPLLNGNSFGCLSEGGQYQFFCEEGYALIGPASRLCVSSKWTGTEPRCEISLGKNDLAVHENYIRKRVGRYISNPIFLELLTVEPR